MSWQLYYLGEAEKDKYSSRVLEKGKKKMKQRTKTSHPFSKCHPAMKASSLPKSANLLKLLLIT